MKITKSQLKRIIKEELAEATSRIVSPMTGEEHWVEDYETDAPSSGPPGGAEDIGAAAYELGRFFGGQLADRAEVVAKALEKVGSHRAAEKLRLGAQAATEG